MYGESPRQNRGPCTGASAGQRPVRTGIVTLCRRRTRGLWLAPPLSAGEGWQVLNHVLGIPLSLMEFSTHTSTSASAWACPASSAVAMAWRSSSAATGNAEPTKPIWDEVSSTEPLGSAAAKGTAGVPWNTPLTLFSSRKLLL